jgi:hypothetical protein
MIQYLSFLAFEFLFVFLLAYWNRKYYNNRLNNFAIAFFSTLFFYVSIIGMVIIIKFLTKRELESFDLDGNGFIDNEEITPASRQAVENASHDTGLAMAPFIGIFYSIIYFILIIIPLAIFNRRKAKNYDS